METFVQMENRYIIAYALCALMLLVLAFVTARYVSNRRQFKIRQSGRGKNLPNTENQPAE
ncbi:MAG: hypothetical protein ACKVOS_04225 [Sphingorhabdus sp.]|uniref:hypothetical protein n=1 Tax=Sphingorhabdus sp. TaxID=1902408 RepID=UPI0038FBE676